MSEGIDNTKLVAKLAEACDEVKGVEKKGQNREQNYKYQKAADVAMAIRHELFSRGIIIVQSENQPEFIQVGTTAKGSPVFECRIGIVYSIMGEGGQIDLVGYGVARDFGDKAIWKAKTGAVKYFLRGLGLIPDEKEDPEFDADRREEEIKWNSPEDRQAIVDRKLKELKTPEPDPEAPELEEIERWKKLISLCSTVADFNAMIPQVKDKPNVIKMALMTASLDAGMTFDRSLGEFVAPKAPQLTPTTNPTPSVAGKSPSATETVSPATPPQLFDEDEEDELTKISCHVVDVDKRKKKAGGEYWLMQCQIEGDPQTVPVQVWDKKLFDAAQALLGKDAVLGCRRSEKQGNIYYALEQIY